MFLFTFLIYLDKPQKSFDDLFGENTKKPAKSDDDDDSFKMSDESDDDFIPSSGILL